MQLAHKIRKESLFEAVGGYATLEVVHKIFYDKVYAHPWLGRFFQGHNQQAIEKRQTDFMAEKMGGPERYMGKEPKMAHRHMYITRELFDVRSVILEQALIEAGVPADLRKRWLKIDGAFFRQICKDSIADFYKNSFRYEKRLIITNPDKVLSK